MKCDVEEDAWVELQNEQIELKLIREIDFDYNKVTQTYLADELPIYYFEKIIGNDFYEFVTNQSKIYFNFCLNDPQYKMSNQEKSMYNKITIGNIKKYIGLYMLSGIIKIPQMKNYWTQDKIYSFPIFRQTLSRDLYFFLNKFIHFNDNTKQKNSKDKIFKLRPIIDYLQKKFIQNRFSSNKYTIDETMISWKGKLHIKQYIPSKPNPYGIKLISLANAINGYMTDFEVFTGKGDKNTAIEYVKSFIQNSHLKSVIFYMDSFFTSIPIAQIIHNSGNFICGVIKSNRKYIPKIDKKAKDTILYYFKPPFYFLYWNSTREVRMLSNFYCSHFIEHDKYDKQEKAVIPKKIPIGIYQYNKYERGVDHNNQMTAYYFPNRKSIKWYKKAFFYLLEIALVNSFKLYQSCCPNTKKKLLEFRTEVIHKLINLEESFDPSKFQKTKYNDRYRGKHFPGKSKSRAQCVICKSKRKYICKTCKIHLCPENCFENYHTKK